MNMVGGLQKGSVPSSEHQLHNTEPPKTVTYADKLKPVEYKRMDLCYIPPTKIEGKPRVQLTPPDIQPGVDKWKNALVGYVLGSNPSFKEMLTYVKTRWMEYGRITVFQMESGVFVFRFKEEHHNLDVLEQGPRSFSWKPLILQNWEPGMKLEKKGITIVPVWVRLPGLCLDCYTPEVLSKIASQLQKESRW